METFESSGDGSLYDLIEPKFLPLIQELIEKNSNFTNMKNPSYYDLNWFLDGWISAYLDAWDTAYELSGQSQNLIWEFISNKYNKIKIPSDFAARLHVTSFL